MYVGNVFLDKTYVNKDDSIGIENLIIGSGTNNILNTNKYIINYRLTNDPPYFVQRDGCVVSFPIYVKGKTKITIRSNNISPAIRWIGFKTDANFTSTGFVGFSSSFAVNNTGEKTDYSVSIPSNAIFMFVCLKPIGAGDNWINDTIALGDSATNDVYIEGSLDGIINPKNSIPLTIKANNEDNYKNYEKIRVTAEYAPLSVGAPSSGITFDKQYNRANFVFFSDSHIDLPRNNTASSISNVKDTIDFVNTSLIDFDGIIHAGDIYTGSGESSLSGWKNELSKFFIYAKQSTKPFIFAVGNHDTADWGNIPANIMTDTAWGDVWFDYA